MSPIFEWDDKMKRVPVRGKYAAAFKKGVDVVVHTEDGDEVHHVRRKADGKFKWKHPSRTVKSGKR